MCQSHFCKTNKIWFLILSVKANFVIIPLYSGYRCAVIFFNKRPSVDSIVNYSSNSFYRLDLILVLMYLRLGIEDEKSNFIIFVQNLCVIKGVIFFNVEAKMSLFCNI